MTIASVLLTIASMFLSWVSLVWVLKGLNIKANSLPLNGDLPMLRVPSFALTTALSHVLKAFKNPIWAEQARERLKQIRLLMKVTSV